MVDHPDRKAEEPDDFARQAEKPQQSLVGEFIDFLRCNKRWWLTPIILVLLIVSLLVLFGGGPAGAFIYTLF